MSVNIWQVSGAGFLQPDDCIIRSRRKQVGFAEPKVERSQVLIRRGQAKDFPLERDRLVEVAKINLASADVRHCGGKMRVEGKCHFIFGNCLAVPPRVRKICALT